MQFARIGDIAMCFATRQQAGEGAPWIVFANSLGTDHRIWDAVADRLEDRFNILVYDKRGHGLSDATPAPYTMDDHIGDLAGLVDHLEIDRFAICGVSVGGMIAQGIADRLADRVTAAIFCDTAHKIGDDAFWQERIGKIEAGGVEAIADGILERWFTPAFCDPDRADYRGYRNMLTRTSLNGYVGTCGALATTDFTDLAAGLSLPVLCIAGAEDRSTPPDLVRSLAGLVPGARFEMIEGAGHIPSIEQPEALAGLIADFIKDRSR
ncbi:3-oxoadipate enol-lactonase [Cucumibacter marinus]|uniref:3-oxoadipate enol-lactonase n=1 Tax=Cucumibacter marinus TaxID=1121252 RepID=UPI00041E012E|nr:3-oxoadipate enol-lactonase [Cucumibacter marinus]